METVKVSPTISSSHSGTLWASKQQNYRDLYICKHEKYRQNKKSIGYFGYHPKFRGISLGVYPNLFGYK